MHDLSETTDSPNQCVRNQPRSNHSQIDHVPSLIYLGSQDFIYAVLAHRCRCDVWPFTSCCQPIHPIYHRAVFLAHRPSWMRRLVWLGKLRARPRIRHPIHEVRVQTSSLVENERLLDTDVPSVRGHCCSRPKAIVLKLQFYRLKAWQRYVRAEPAGFASLLSQACPAV